MLSFHVNKKLYKKSQYFFLQIVRKMKIFENFPQSKILSDGVLKFLNTVYNHHRLQGEVSNGCVVKVIL